jgi:cytochrome c oxidase subunit 3
MASAHADSEHAEHAGHGDHPPYLAHHFDTPEQQFDSAKLGMWVFIVTEILMFGGLFVAYLIYKGQEPAIFIEAHNRLDWKMGSVNTIVLLFSSLTAALAVRSSQLGKKNETTMWLTITILCALAFLGIKYVEYSHKFHDGLLPGRFFTAHLPEHAHNGHVLPQRASMFFALYFMMTGLHGLHVVIGMSILGWVLVRNHRGQFSPEYFTPVEIGALYWHLVDLVWIYLFPLVYLVG